MPRKQKLKVYRTPIGFHDAYVAAPSQKAALKAWGADADLFARGIAEVVTDEALTREPLDQPGTVIRKPRGTSADYMAALPKDEPRPKKKPEKKSKPEAPARKAPAPKPKPQPKPKPKLKPKPRPSRDELDWAEQALEQAQTGHDAAIADIREREKALQQQRRALERQHEEQLAELEAARAEAWDRYKAALEAWRSG